MHKEFLIIHLKLLGFFIVFKYWLVLKLFGFDFLGGRMGIESVALSYGRLAIPLLGFLKIILGKISARHYW